MDKYEYKLRSEEIRSLIAEGEYAEAAAIADTIDWRRVRSVMMLCTISDLYKINRRYEDARDMLLLAYEKHPGGRSIVYSLCELSIKMEDVVHAVEYYKEFVQVAPKDSGRYVLQYRLYEAQEVSLEERIEVLEELKAKDYTEKWAYELAYLYHRIGLGTKCVEECDELIMWFGEGKYVQKALELKMLHAPLNEEQQEKYDRIKSGAAAEENAGFTQTSEQEAPDVSNAPTKVIPQDELERELDIQVKMVNVGQYDTINIQKALAENMKELMDAPIPEASSVPESILEEPTVVLGQVQEEEEEEEASVDPAVEEKAEEISVAPEAGEAVQEISAEPEPAQDNPAAVESAQEIPAGPEDMTANVVMEQMKLDTMGITDEIKEWHIKKNPVFEKILGMEYDGQISMVVPEAQKIEKQITGQISLEDVLVEWERVKKESEQKRKEALRQHVIEQTGEMFTEFDAATRDGLLQQIENDSMKPDDAVEKDEFDELEEFGGANRAVGEPEESVESEEPYGTEPDRFEEIEEPGEPAEESGEADEFEELEELTGSEKPEESEEAGEFEGLEEPAKSEEIEEPGEPAAEESGETDEFEELEELTGSEKAEESEKPEESEEAGEFEELEESAKSADTQEPVKDKKPVEEGSAAEKKGPADEESEQEERTLSPEEKKLFGSYFQNGKTKRQILNALDHVSMAAYTGNVIITGDEGTDTMTLAKNLVKDVQQTDSNFSGKVAKISAEALNQRKVSEIVKKMANGALIVQGAGKLEEQSVAGLLSSLEQDSMGIVVILEDSKKSMRKFLAKNERIRECFNIEINIDALDNDALVAYAKEYAREQEYSIDEMGVLALHTRIAEMQTSDHAVTVSEVKDILDEAIRSANRKTPGHFFDILLAKRYDDDDMIVLREHDFI